MAKTYIDNKGYERFSDSGNLVHRWAATKRIGRKLKSGEVIHHIDRDKKNNSPSNLWVFHNQYAHNAIHERDKRRHGINASYHGFNANKSGCLMGILLIVTMIVLVIIY